jgi:hypothetical protein
MRSSLFLGVILLVVWASLAGAQVPRVGVYADMQAVNCNIMDSSSGLLPMYCVITNTAGVTAVQFAAPKPACMTSMYLSDTNLFSVTVGNSQTGVSVGIGTCQGGSIHVVTINYFAMGTTPPCCEYPTIPDPLAPSGEIEFVDCSFNLMLGDGVTNTVNGNAGCPCPIGGLAVAVGVPPDMVIPAMSTIPSISLVGFHITNMGSFACAFDYFVSKESGPCTLVDQGDPASLSGPTPILAPGASYSPPPAGLLIPEIREVAEDYVAYLAIAVGHPDVAASGTTLITFQPPVPTKLTTWGGIKALYTE